MSLEQEVPEKGEIDGKRRTQPAMPGGNRCMTTADTEVDDTYGRDDLGSS